MLGRGEQIEGIDQAWGRDFRAFCMDRSSAGCKEMSKDKTERTHTQ